MAERQEGIIKSGSTEAKAFPESPGNVSPVLEAKEGGGVIKAEAESASYFNKESELRNKEAELRGKKYALVSKYREKKSEAEKEAGGFLNLSSEQRREIDDGFKVRQKQEEAKYDDEIKILEEKRRKSQEVTNFDRGSSASIANPTQSTPTQPTPTEPTPTEPTPTQPTPTQPTPTEPTPTEPTPTEPTPTEPTPTEPTPAELAEQKPSVEGATVVEVETLEELPPVLKKVLEPEIVQNQEVEIDWGRLKKDVNEHIKGGYPDAEGIISKIDTKLKEQESLGLLFDDSRLSAKDRIINVKLEDFQSNRDIWFLGDVHGDYLGLCAAISYATQVSNKSNKTPCFFYLGDLFDRGPHGHLVMLELFNQVCDKEIDVGMVLGNHDEGLGCREDGHFTGIVEPAEFVDWLNREENKTWSELGRACVEFFLRVPRAIFLPDGLMIAHGGVPHEDCQEGGLNWEMLNENFDCLHDFVWTRVHEKKKLSYPNRANKGHQLGINAFNSFCETTKEISEISVPVQRLLRGHDHFVDGHKWYDRYQEYGVLTLNTRCFHPDLRANKSQYLAVARWVDNRLPEVHRISVPAEVIDEIYHEEMTGE